MYSVENPDVKPDYEEIPSSPPINTVRAPRGFPEPMESVTARSSVELATIESNPRGCLRCFGSGPRRPESNLSSVATTDSGHHG